MSIIDTADAIKIIEALSQEQCADECWCRLVTPSTNTKERFRWAPSLPALRFRAGEWSA